MTFLVSFKPSGDSILLFILFLEFLSAKVAGMPAAIPYQVFGFSSIAFTHHPMSLKTPGEGKRLFFGDDSSLGKESTPLVVVKCHDREWFQEGMNKCAWQR